MAVKVLVIDDSAFMRQVITRMLQDDPAICVVGTARDGEDALEKVARLSPNVLTLDLEMPRLDGLAFLRRLLAIHPLPVVVVSSWAAAGADRTISALALGAVDFVTKPVAVPSDEMLSVAEELRTKVKAAAAARIPGHGRQDVRPSLPIPWGEAADAAICCLAASTGGPRALQSIVTKLPADFPLPLLLIQHMPPGFTKVFACRLNELSSLPVREAQDGEALSPGEVLIAPAGWQTSVDGVPGRLFVRVGIVPDSFFRPSADLTYKTIAGSCGARAIGAILTGMGQDGAHGLLAMSQAGACTLAEAAETCVVHGMPRAAVEIGAARWVLPLWEIPTALMILAGRGDRGMCDANRI